MIYRDTVRLFKLLVMQVDVVLRVAALFVFFLHRSGSTPLDRNIVKHSMTRMWTFNVCFAKLCAFADDMVIYAQFEESLHNKINLLKEELIKYNLTINKGKIKVTEWQRHIKH